MDVVIHNAEEAAKACLPQMSWWDVDGYHIMESDAPLNVPPSLPPDTPIVIVRSDCIYQVEEVPCGWCVFWGPSEFAKQMREIGEPGNAEGFIGGGPFVVNRWTGKVKTISEVYLPSWKAAVLNYIYRLPQGERDMCRRPEFWNKWEPDPIRFWPPELHGVEVDTMTDLEDIRFALEVDDAGQDLLIGTEPHFSGMSLRGNLPNVRACSIVDVKQEGVTKTYTVKPEFEMPQVNSLKFVTDKVTLATHASENFPDGVWLGMQIRIGE